MEGASSARQSSPDNTDEDNSGDSPRYRAYHTKRPHKKSRGGCTNCKHRKVKCDEAHPVCRACSLRNENCVYVQTTSRRLAPPVTQPRPLPQRSSPESSPAPLVLFESETYKKPTPLVIEPLFRPYGVEQDEMKLLWFFTANTCKSFNAEPAREEAAEKILRIDLMQHAFDKRFLLDTVIALSSHHAESLGMSVNRSRSLAYRVTAIQGYTNAVEAADPDTFQALLATSLLMAALASADFRDPNSPDLHIVGWMMVWRGIGLMIERLTLKNFLQSNLCRLFYRPSVDLAQAGWHIPLELRTMLACIQPNDPEFVDIEPYHSTLKYLGSLYQHLEDGLSSLMKLRIVTWLTFVPSRFTELVRQLQPRALVIMAHYAAFLKLVQRVWWMTGVGDRALADIIRHLSAARWHRYLRRPIEVSKLHDNQKIGQVLTGDGTWQPREVVNDVPPEATSNLTYVDDIGNPVSLMGDTVVRGGPSGQTVFNSKLHPPEYYSDNR